MDESDINEDQLAITLDTDTKKLSMSEIKIYYNIVKKSISDGLIRGIQVQNEKYGKKSAVLIHRKVEDHNLYIIPLTRNLLIYEVTPIKRKLVNKFKFEFELRYSDTNMVPISAPR